MVAAKKAFVRKADDLDLSSAKQLQTLQSQAQRAVEYARSVRAELEEARVTAANLERLKADLENSTELQRRSVTAISKLREVLESTKEEKKEAVSKAEAAEAALIAAKEEAQKLREELESEKQKSEMRRKEYEALAKKELQMMLEETKSAYEPELKALQERLRQEEAEKQRLLGEIEQLRNSAVPVVVSPPPAPAPAVTATTGPPSAAPPPLDRISSSMKPVKKRNDVADEDLALSFLSVVGSSSPRQRSASLAEALGEAPPIRKRSGSISLPRETTMSDDTWKTWVTEPYVYDQWTVFQNSVPPQRESGPLILTIKGHSFEFGMPTAPPLDDPSVRDLVEPLERILYYQKDIAHRDHVHFLCASTSGEHLVVTLESANAFNRSTPLLALVQSKKHSVRAIIDMEKSVALPPKAVLLEDFLNASFPGCNLKRVDNPTAHDLVSQRLIEFENMHLDFNRRVGVLYWKSGQTENEAFGNNMSPGLDEFLNFFGERIQLKGWSKFRGGLNVVNNETGEHSVYAEFEKFGFMCHVSALLPYRGFFFFFFFFFA